MTNLAGKTHRLRKAIAKLKELNNTQAMKKQLGGQSAFVQPAAVAANQPTPLPSRASSFMGMNSPAIFTAESQYQEMWAQDVSVMAGYNSGSGGT